MAVKIKKHQKKQTFYEYGTYSLTSHLSSFLTCYLLLSSAIFLADSPMFGLTNIRTFCSASGTVPGILTVRLHSGMHSDLLSDTKNLHTI